MISAGRAFQAEGTANAKALRVCLAEYETARGWSRWVRKDPLSILGSPEPQAGLCPGAGSVHRLPLAACWGGWVKG